MSGDQYVPRNVPLYAWWTLFASAGLGLGQLFFPPVGGLGGLGLGLAVASLITAVEFRRRRKSGISQRVANNDVVQPTQIPSIRSLGLWVGGGLGLGLLFFPPYGGLIGANLGLSVAFLLFVEQTRKNPTGERPQWRRWLRAFFLVSALCLVAAASSVLTLLWPEWFTRLPPLAAGLPWDYSDAERRFRQRVQQTFPVGSSERDLIRELERQGFHPGWSHAKLPASASLYRNAFPCRKGWEILWRVDEGGVIHEIQGFYRLACL